MTKKLLWIIGLLLLFSPLFAKQVPLRDAQTVALRFFWQRINQYHPVDLSSLNISEAFITAKDHKSLYYIFNFSQGGWIAVSADDVVKPVLAFSFEGRYSETNQAPQFIAWVEQYAKQIKFAMDSDAKPDPSVMREWSDLLTDNPSGLKVFKGANVEPFITSNWNQNNPYNGMCPVDPMGPGGHVYAGCVPTAMGQIMYYYRWPDHGIGSYTYLDSTYGVQHVNYDSAWYEWNNMKNTISSENNGIARLLYHIGVSCDLRWGANGSGMYNHKAAYAYRTFFKFSPETQYLFRDSTTINWDSVIIAHLNRRMPLYYAGWSVPNINGHAFVCDGYQDSSYFHFNFGWSGSYNGYFYLDNLTPGGNNFNLSQELVINIYPDTLQYSYPPYCSNTTILRFREGSLTDGSGPKTGYQPLSDCQWLIDPQTNEDSISSVTLTFDKFDLAAGDTVTIYDGISILAPVLGSFTGTALPPAQTTSKNKMLIRFISDAGSSAQGFSATYTSSTPTWCSGTTTINGDTANFTDGSFRFNYHNTTNCKWKLLSDSAKPLTIYFRYFDTEPDNDVLKIYDLNSQALLASISGHYDSLNPPDSVTCQSGKMFLMFTSNSSVTGKGWEIYYPRIKNLGINDESLPGLQVFPNPAKENIRIRFYNDLSGSLEISLLNVAGQMIYSESGNMTPGWISKSIDLSGIEPGISILQIRTEKQIITKKILITQ